MQRLVESQEQVATNALVRTLAEQALLERLIEGTKPRPPPAADGLHYLLLTPFRYPPLRYGSRFGRRTEPSLFYGARGIETVLAEGAYYRFVFWSGMEAAPAEALKTRHTVFRTQIQTERGLRLQEPPFSMFATQLQDRAQLRCDAGTRHRDARGRHRGIRVSIRARRGRRHQRGALYARGAGLAATASPGRVAL